MKKWLQNTINFLVGLAALNWGLTVFGWDLIEMLLGKFPTTKVIVLLGIGATGLYKLLQLFGWIKK